MPPRPEEPTLRFVVDEQNGTLTTTALPPGPDDCADLFHGQEHPLRVAGEGGEPEPFVPSHAARKRVFAAVRDDIEQDRVAAGDVGYRARLFEDMMHEDAAETEALRRPVHGDLTEEQHRKLPVGRCAAGPTFEFGHVHHAQGDRMIAEDACAALLDSDIDAGHVVPLLLPCAQLQIIVEATDAAIETVAFVPRRFEELDSEGR